MLRLSLDMGTNSIGWAAIRDDHHIIDLGARIFSNGRTPQSNAPLNEARRVSRSNRRRRDRFVGRRSSLMTRLTEFGFMPKRAEHARALAKKDPYMLRKKGLDYPLSRYEIGRALHHINQRRGFKSNRKADRQNTSETGVIEKGGHQLDTIMQEAGARTLGEFLFFQRTKRIRRNNDKEDYAFYPHRRHYEEEFEMLWQAQRLHHPDLMTERVKEIIQTIIFYQRPLKPPSVGPCLFEPTESRLPKAHPLFQERRLYETINHLRLKKIGEQARSLTLDERDLVYRALQKVKQKSFKSLRKDLSLPPEVTFTVERDSNKNIDGHAIDAAFSKKTCFGPAWREFSVEKQWDIISLLQESEDPSALLEQLISTYGLTSQHATDVMAVPLPTGYGAIGQTASLKIIEQLKKEVITYAEAVRRCAWHHSLRPSGDDAYAFLPYYGKVLHQHITPGRHESNPDEKQFGKITNPTVHIGLRQLEKLVNAFICLYGKPDEIIVETARDLSRSQKEKKEIEKQQNQNQKEAEKHGKYLNELGHKNTRENRARLKLWEALHHSPMQRCCPYCGGTLSARMVFSDEVEIDHILPYSRTLDNTNANKTIAHRHCNRTKGNQTPWERWHTEERWQETILPLVSHLPKNKQWRFDPNAMERFEHEENGFMTRQLVDTRYLSRMVALYLECLYPPRKDHKRHVYAIPGQLTALLRHEWGLNSLLDPKETSVSFRQNARKNRLDHRHHALDAVVVGVTTQGTLQKMVTAAQHAQDKGQARLFCELEMPWETFRQDVKKALSSLTVSHKIDHGVDPKARHKKQKTTSGALFKETTYGPTGIPGFKKGHELLTHRVNFLSLTAAQIDSDTFIADKTLRKTLQKAWHHALSNNTSADKKPILEKILKNIQTAQGPFQGIRHLRVHEDFDVAKVKKITNSQGMIEKIYPPASNHSAIIWEMPNGTWVDQIIPIYAANATMPERPHPAARKVIELHKNDMVAIEDSSGHVSLMRVVSSSKGIHYFVLHHEAGDLTKRHNDKNDPFTRRSFSASTMKKMKLRKVRVDILGHVTDHGFKKR